MTVRIIQVDAFASAIFGGNPAAVCILDAPAPEPWMRSVATEMNLSETAFLHPVDDGYNLRWFTPAVEVDLCGHATLAAAHVLYEDGHVAGKDVCIFQTHSGKLTARRHDGLIRMDFPLGTYEDWSVPLEVASALGIDSAVAVRSSHNDALIEVPDADAVRNLAPDFSRLKRVDLRGFILTSRGEGDFDFVSRFFAPSAGIDEDPVTGSAHCVLGAYWSGKLGKTRMRAHQVSARGGELLVEVDGDRCHLSGEAITVMRAELFSDPS